MRAHDGTPPYHGADNRGRPIYRVPEYLVDLMRQLRQGATTEEAALWICLRDRQLLGAKFRRQHAIGRYVADFYCHEARLVVELDGAVHHGAEPKADDALRDERLEGQSLRVLRVWNSAVRDDIGQVLTTIADILSERLSQPEPSPPAPLPEGEG